MSDNRLLARRAMKGDAGHRSSGATPSSGRLSGTRRAGRLVAEAALSFLPDAVHRAANDALPQQTFTSVKRFHLIGKRSSLFQARWQGT